MGVIEKLGEFVPLDLTFIDAQGDSVILGELLGKPTILSFVYFDCPGLCTPILNGLVDVLERYDGAPGQDYNVVTITIDESETVLQAAQKKKSILASFHSEFPDQAWHFLTGEKETIAKVSRGAGFHFKRQGEDFAHPGLVTVLAPDGKIIRYLYGIKFNPFDLKMALIEAREGRPGPTIAKVLRYCFSYDPEGRKYALNILKVSATMIIFLSLLFVGYLVVTSKNRRTEVEVR